MRVTVSGRPEDGGWRSKSIQPFCKAVGEVDIEAPSIGEALPVLRSTCRYCVCLPQKMLATA